MYTSRFLSFHEIIKDHFGIFNVYQIYGFFFYYILEEVYFNVS